LSVWSAKLNRPSKKNHQEKGINDMETDLFNKQKGLLLLRMREKPPRENHVYLYD